MAQRPDISGYIRQTEAAHRLNMDKAQFARMVQSGRVEYIESGDGLRLIPLSEVERLQAERRKPGRPKASA